LSASACRFGDWFGLAVSAGRRQSFRFTRVDAAAFATAAAKARDALRTPAAQ
jgi:hypothetical protein